MRTFEGQDGALERHLLVEIQRRGWDDYYEPGYPWMTVLRSEVYRSLSRIRRFASSADAEEWVAAVYCKLVFAPGYLWGFDPGRGTMLTQRWVSVIRHKLANAIRDRMGERARSPVICCFSDLQPGDDEEFCDETIQAGGTARGDEADESKVCSDFLIQEFLDYIEQGRRGPVSVAYLSRRLRGDTAEEIDREFGWSVATRERIHIDIQWRLAQYIEARPDLKAEVESLLSRLLRKTETAAMRPRTSPSPSYYFVEGAQMRQVRVGQQRRKTVRIEQEGVPPRWVLREDVITVT